MIQPVTSIPYTTPIGYTPTTLAQPSLGMGVGQSPFSMVPNLATGTVSTTSDPYQQAQAQLAMQQAQLIELQRQTALLQQQQQQWVAQLQQFPPPPQRPQPPQQPTQAVAPVSTPPATSPSTTSQTPTTSSPPAEASTPPTKPPETSPAGKKKPVDDNKPTIILDPGHGFKDPGAVGADGTKEEDIVLAVSKGLAGKLESQGYRVIWTRDDTTSDDKNYGFWQETKEQGLISRDSLKKRRETKDEIRQKYPNSLFLSVHANAASGNASGTETFYSNQSPESKAFAEALQQELATVRPGSPNRGVKTASFAVINTGKPEQKNVDSLVELGFVSNKEELDFMKANPDKYAEALFKAINTYKP
jgi:N-acetylmuramoyl-L-alanine amidase